MALTEVRKRTSQASYLDIAGNAASTPEFEFMGTGFTELNEEPGAQTSSKRYVNNSAATRAITGYEWQTPFNADQIKSEKAIKYIIDVGKFQKNGAEAETDYIIVDLDEAAAGENAFAARKFHVAIEVASFTDNDGEMGCEGNLLGVGDPVVGTFNTTTKTFAEGVQVGS
ncbi:hypothetical protein OBO34_21770 [Clostridiales Family XIII bacterium ASD5510]|uniref:Uncharacterized protein n=2 Tax=Bacteria TaxID=2 RepID=A0A9J6QZI4_9FIRM|nr:hypothetical protein [Hominibacterium faecale]MCU7380947.1 hypothetical protein [Hominibacterium faecale]